MNKTETIKLSSFCLGSQSPEKAVDFYQKVLGMELLETRSYENIRVYILRFPQSDAGLELPFVLGLELRQDMSKKNCPYYQEGTDAYWKYSVFVDDIQLAYEKLKDKTNVSEPFQFGDIGYLMHLTDSENYNIEFIQKSFKQNMPKTLPNPNQNQNQNSEPKSNPDINSPLHQIPVMGLITMRTKDPVKSIRFYEQFFGLRLLVRMYVDHGTGFSLYFLGDKHLEPPYNDIDAVENREWMYQQNTCFIELQHYWGSEFQKEFTLSHKADEPMGFKAIQFKTDNLQTLKHDLDSRRVAYANHFDPLGNKEEIHIVDPDGRKIIVE